MIEKYALRPLEEDHWKSITLGTPSVPRLKACPHCSYSLKGLPIAHRCPECGFKYDSATRVWIQDNRMRASGLLVGLITIGTLAWSFTRAVSPGNVPIELQYGVLAVWLLVLLRSILLASRRPTVAIGPEGVSIRVGWSGESFVPYEQVEEAISILQSGRSFVYICLRDGARIDCTPAMSDQDAVDQLTSELSHRIKCRPRGL